MIVNVAPPAGYGGYAREPRGQARSEYSMVSVLTTISSS